MSHYFQKYFVLVAIVSVIVIGFLVLRNEESQLPQEEYFLPVELSEEIEASEVTKEEKLESYIVDIKGAVAKPGVYEVDSLARVHDVITLAGGLTDGADEARINLAQKVQDEMVIYVPEKGEDDDVTNLVLATNVSKAGEQKVNVNQATKEEIETLPGIGPAKAQAIIEYRDENGPFQQVEDLLQVNGIGEKTLENLREYVAIP